MKNLVSVLVTAIMILGLTLSAWAQNNIPSAQKQIKAAVSPAPAELQAGASVLGYDENGQLISLRQGSNELICLADDPKEARFHVACYHKDLEPFMKRGRELRKEGKERAELQQIRQQEIEAGTISLPQKPMALYSLTGKSNGYDYAAETLREASPLYVIYIPYATKESTGISPQPFGKGAPWLMDAGKPWAHIMISTGETLGEAGED